MREIQQHNFAARVAQFVAPLKKSLVCMILQKITVLMSVTYLFISTAADCQALSSADIKESMMKDWERAKAFTIDYLNAMPTEKYSFKPVDSIRSFGSQMLHLAWVNVFVLSLATNQTTLPWAQASLQTRATAQSRDSVYYYVTESYDYCINAIKNSDVNKWAEKVKFRETEGSRFEFINKAFEHQTHMRGQTTIYIRLQGIRPPQERL